MCAFHDYIDDIARHSSIPESFENMTISDVMAWTIHVDNFTRLHGLDVSSYYAATEVGKEEVKVDPVSRFSMPEVEK
jgi:hypothetical protein